MAEEIKISAEKREVCGSAKARALRRAGKIPAVLANHGGGETLLTLDSHEFELMLRKHMSEQLVLTLNLAGEDKLVLLRELQHSGLTGRVTHADFGEISKDAKLRVHIPVLLVGEPSGVRNGGGVMEQMIRELEVECLPQYIVDKFEVNVESLEVGQDLTVAQLSLGGNYTVITSADLAVVVVAEPSAEEDSAPAAAEGEAPAEPELIAKKAKDDGAAAAPAEGKAKK